MFDFFKGKDKSDQSSGESTPSTGTGIGYDPSLISKLKGDHQELLKLYGNVNAAFTSGDFPSVIRELDKFRVALHAHLLLENVKFYIYLRHSLAEDPTSYELANGFKKEMDGIGKAVMAFLTKYQSIGVDKDLANTFGAELAGIGKVLVDRINREEGTLYPLYHQSY